jgi:hypothetical protein
MLSVHGNPPSFMSGAWMKNYSNLKGLLESEVPDFQPVGVEEQGRLDQKKPVTCPHCGEEFTPK